MAVTTPTLWLEATTVKPDQPLEVSWAPFAATAGTLAKVQVRVYDDGSRTTLLWDSLQVAPDDHAIGDQWAVLWPEWWGWVTGYVDVIHVSSVPETSSASALVAVTVEAAELDYIGWAEVQG